MGAALANGRQGPPRAAKAPAASQLPGDRFTIVIVAAASKCDTPPTANNEFARARPPVTRARAHLLSGARLGAPLLTYGEPPRPAPSK